MFPIAEMERDEQRAVSAPARGVSSTTAPYGASSGAVSGCLNRSKRQLNGFRWEPTAFVSCAENRLIRRVYRPFLVVNDAVKVILIKRFFQN